MDNALTLTEFAHLGDLAKKTESFVKAAKAPATLKAYRSDWSDFESWCLGKHLRSLPAEPEIIALYISDLASTCAAGTIARRLTSITKAHQAAGYAQSPSSTRNLIVGEALKGIRRTIGTSQRGKDALLTPQIKLLLAHCPSNSLGSRDAALFLAGYAGAFRRSELAAIQVSDLKFTEDGVIVILRRSKTDQEGAGREVGLPWGSNPDTCPVRCLRRWIDEAGIADGPVFRGVDRHGRVSRSGLNKDSIGTIIKRAALRAGLRAEPFAGHSLRAGHATQASMNGVGELIIMKQTGHRSLPTLRKYIRSGQLFRQNAASGLGL
jgi:site-specific recombinase XerD